MSKTQTFTAGGATTLTFEKLGNGMWSAYLSYSDGLDLSIGAHAGKSIIVLPGNGGTEIGTLSVKEWKKAVKKLWRS